MDSNIDVVIETDDICVDQETGEVIPQPHLNLETGEMEQQPSHKPRRFRVPSIYLQDKIDNEQPKCSNKFKYDMFNSEIEPTPISNSHPNGNKLVTTLDTYSNNEITTSGDRVITESYPVGSVILFLLPTLFFCPLACAIAGSVIEAVLHWWAHKKNSQNATKMAADKNKMVWYQSPLHLLASEFCFACKDECSKEKISKYQDKRNNSRINKIRKSMEYVRSVVI